MNDELILSNEKLIYFVLGKMGLYDKKDSLYEIGLIGLVKAGNTFDPTRGFQFSTYACNSIRLEVLRYLRAENLDKRKANYNTISLETIIHDDGEKELQLIDTLKSDIDLEKEIVEKEEKELLNKALLKLNETELFIINHYYGLNGCEELKQKDIAKELDVTQAQISRLKDKAMKKLKNIIKEELK